MKYESHQAPTPSLPVKQFMMKAVDQSAISGGISLENPNLLIEGQQALINTDKETAIIKNANYFSNIPARGSSEEFRIEEDNICI